MFYPLLLYITIAIVDSSCKYSEFQSLIIWNCLIIRTVAVASDDRPQPQSRKRNGNTDVLLHSGQAVDSIVKGGFLLAICLTSF